MNFSSPHAVMICSPGIGHLIPFLELSKRLTSLYSFKVSVLFISTAQSTSQHSFTGDGVDFLEIPAADVSNLVDSNAQFVTKLFVLMRETGPAIRAAISRLKLKPTVLIFDVLATGYVSMAREFGLPIFVYVTATARFLALSIYCSAVLDKEIEGEYINQTEPFKIPGCKPIKPDDVVEPMWDRTDQMYKEYLQMGFEIPLFDGVLLNTWHDLESSTLSALREDGLMKKIIRVPVFDIGPLTKTSDLPLPGHEINKSKEISEWLDRQPNRSVMYVSFGSGGTLSTAQMAELAWGLELSQQRFVWVVRPPMDGEVNASYLGLRGEVDDENGKYKYLPDGFVERSSGFGLLVSEWAPQTEILANRAIGGFLTHCGWNSALESILNGVPMIAWPLYAEQRMNAAMLVEELEVAIRPEELPVKRVVAKEEIEKMVRSVLEGEEQRRLRKRVEALRKSGIQALSDNGSSFRRLSQFVQSIKHVEDLLGLVWLSESETK